MEPWDYIRFVYETESMMALGADVTLPTGVYAPSPPDWTDPEFPGQRGSGDPGGGGGWQPKTPDVVCKDKDGNPRPSKECDETVGTGIVDPCWELNEYPGIGIYPEDGLQKTLSTEHPLTRGPYKSVKVESGWGNHGDGAFPGCFQGSVVYLVRDDGGPHDCITFGWSDPCRNPATGFPINLKPCSGTQISVGGDITRADLNPIATMWERFEECMRTKFPECETEEEG